MTDLQDKITNMVEQSYHDPKAFETFANDLLNLGITRLNLDTFNDEMSFYTSNLFVHKLIRMDLKEAKKNKPWTLGKMLEVDKLENAIKELDCGKMSVPEFHREMFSAGVIFCVVYLTFRKIYYMSQDGLFYLENY